MRLLFLFAYTCSGIAGLIYQVCWTRLLTLYIGHTTAAASAVVAAFLGGLAVGAAVGGALASRITARQALIAYALLEIGAAAAAPLISLAIQQFTPLLASLYANGEPSALFAIVRVVVCLVLVFGPACALGATFPMAVRWFAAGAASRAGSSGALYATNAAGAAIGALTAGFVLIPLIGVSGTTWVGVGASVLAAAAVAVILAATAAESPALEKVSIVRARRGQLSSSHTSEPEWLAALVLGLSGFAALVHEIAWTRVLTMVLGPTTYAFAATVTAIIVGIALGSAISSALVRRMRTPAFALSIVLGLAAVSDLITASLMGGSVPRALADQIAGAPDAFHELLWRGGILTAALVVPTAALFGAAFPLALAMVDKSSRTAAGSFATVYSVNTLGSVAGSMLAGFALIPWLGLETTLRAVAVCLIVAAVVVVSQASLTRAARVKGGIAIVLALAVMAGSIPWDRELLASGVYMYAPFVPKGLPLEPLLKAGTLLYYREGAAATVSVKKLTGTTTLAVDGKTDASNRGDMLTQKLVAHLPLLLHHNPREIAVIGLGSGVTVGSALTHPIARADVIEISPEVVEASGLFVEENRSALADPRTNLLVADGRTHLLLSQRKYDVIISEPSNPWIAGVAALFTREFFLAARARLAPGGVICQWANAYNISDRDLRSIVATFQSVFPHGVAWLVGGDDVVLIASDDPVDRRLEAIQRHWYRDGVAEDLARVGALEPFALWSLFVGDPEALEAYAADAPVLTDDTMTLEFSGPRELGAQTPGRNGAVLKALLTDADGPLTVRTAIARADTAQWTRRGRMMFGRDAFSDAYDDYLRALELDGANRDALTGFVRTAILTRRGAAALEALDAVAPEDPMTPEILVARSRLLASIGFRAEALQLAGRASEAGSSDALEQLAWLHAEASDSVQLEGVLQRMRAAAPDHPATHYYSAVQSLFKGQAADALQRARAVVSIDPAYAAAYDLIGAAHTQLGEFDEARAAFLTSLRHDAHDSTAYANLGLLALEAGDLAVAADHFAEALWLDPDSTLAREGLIRAMGAS